MPMPRTAASPRFLLATALCSGLIVAFASWLAEDYSDGVRATAALVGLGIALAFMLSVAWALEEDEASEAATVRSTAVARSPSAWPIAAPSSAFGSEASAVVAAPSSSQAARDAFTGRLEEGRALREDLEPGSSDARVGVWIEGARHTMEQHKPGLVGFFNALGARTYLDDCARLDAHIRRLATIIRDFVPTAGNVG
jgi:hypothetical protein